MWQSLLDAHTMFLLPFFIIYGSVILYLGSKYKQIKHYIFWPPLQLGTTHEI